MSVSLRAHTSLYRLVQRTVTTASVSPTSESSTSTFDNLLFDDLVDNLGRTASETSNKGLSFATMLRRSKFMQLGNFENRLIVGKVIRRVADDLYIDIGLKFHAVCKAPAVNNEVYVRNSKVLVRLHDSELSQRFLGSSRDLTLLEADATLLRILYSPLGPVRPRTEKKEDSKVSKEETKTELQSNE